MLSLRPLLWLIGWFVLVVVLASEGARQSRNWTLSELYREGTDRLLGNITQLRSALDQYRYLPFILTQSEEVRALLREPDMARSEQVNRYLEQINLIAGSGALLILDPYGYPQALSNWRDQRALLSRPQADRLYFRQAAAGENGRQFVHEGEPPRPVLYLSAPIYDRQALAGVAAMRLELEQLREHLPIDTPFFITDEHGELLLALATDWPLPESVPMRLPDGTRVSQLKRGNQEWMLQQVQLDDLGWQVGILSDTSSVLTNQMLVAGSIGGTGFALALLVLYLRESGQKRRLQRERQLEQALSEERQRDMISTAEVGLINVDRDGLIQFINPMAMQQFGVSLQLMRNRSLQELLEPGGAGELLQDTLQSLGSERFRPLTGAEMVGRRADGTAFPMMVSVRGMAHHPELGYLVTVIDISRRKRLEQALREANESLEQKVIERTRALEDAQAELVQAGKLAALGRMSASVVHELNQPLTALRTYLAIGRRLLDQPELLKQNLAQLESLIDRMALITGQLKTFAYRKPEQVVAVPVAQSIDQVLALFRGRFAEMQLQLDYVAPEPELRIGGDQARFEQVLINLIKNACDAMQTGVGPHRLSLTVQLAAEQVVLRVCDNGPGIAPEHRAQLFEPFFTTKEVGSGLGLGLAIVHSIVRDLGGDIEVTDATRGGACFSVRLPRWQTANATTE